MPALTPLLILFEQPHDLCSWEVELFSNPAKRRIATAYHVPAARTRLHTERDLKIGVGVLAPVQQTRG